MNAIFYFHANDQDYTFNTIEEARKAAVDFPEINKIRDTNFNEYFL